MADSDPPSSAPGEDDLGEPIEELAGYSEPVPEGMWGRVVRSLRRRSLGAHIATLTWSALGEVVAEYLKMIHSMFQSGRTDQGE